MKQQRDGDHERQQHVHRNAGDENEKSRGKWFALEEPVLGNWQRPEGNHRVRVEVRAFASRRGLTATFEKGRVLVQPRGHAHVATERQRGEDVFRLAPSLAEERRTKADRKARRVHADGLCGDEVPELMNEDHEPEDENRRQYR